GEAAIGHQRDRLAKPSPLERAGHVEHLAHARPAARPLVADHDHVVRLDPTFLDSLERVLLALEHARGAAVRGTALTGDLDHTAAWRDVPAQDRESAHRLDGPRAGLVRRLDR